MLLREEDVLGRGGHEYVFGSGTEQLDGLIWEHVEVLG
jgi:hypothetical protein